MLAEGGSNDFQDGIHMTNKVYRIGLILSGGKVSVVQKCGAKIVAVLILILSTKKLMHLIPNIFSFIVLKASNIKL